MTFRPDPSVLVPINSQRGVDGSVSPLKLADGFCRELENADITTAGIIKKRGGYATTGGALPVSIIDDTLYAKEYPIGKQPYLVRAYALTDGYGLEKLRESVGYMQLPTDIEDKNFLVEFWQDPDYPVTENTAFYYYSGGDVYGDLRYVYAPLAVYAGKYALFSRDAYDSFKAHNSGGAGPAWGSFTTSWAFSTAAADVVYGRRSYVWEVYPHDLITAVSVVGKTLVLSTTKTLPIGTPVKLHGQTIQTTNVPDGVVTGFVSDTDHATYVTLDFSLLEFLSGGTLSLSYSAGEPVYFRYVFFQNSTQSFTNFQTDWNCFIWAAGANKFVAGGNVAVIYSSDDSVQWDVTLPAGITNIDSIAYSSSLGIYCAASGTDLYYSSNLETWTAGVGGTGEYQSHLCWSPDLGIFCAIGPTTAATSPDGINWTSAAHGAAITTSIRFGEIVWSPTLGLFCCVPNGLGTYQGVLTSADGLVWTSTPIVGFKGNGVCWSPTLGLFCAINQAAVIIDEFIWTSPDGINWTNRTVPISYSWASIEWSPSLGIFCAISTNGQKSLTSPDGIVWTDHVTGVAYSGSGINITKLRWSSTLSLFCAANATRRNSGVGVVTSSNGTGWAAVPVYGDFFFIGTDNSVSLSTDGTYQYTTSLPGSGVAIGDVQTVENYYDVIEDTNSLATISHGRVYSLPDPYTYETVFRVDAPPAFSSTGTVTLTNGVFSVPFTDASTYYQVGDTIAQNTYDSYGNLLSSLTLAVTATSGTHLTVTSDVVTSITYRSGEIWHFTRSALSIPAATIVPGITYVVPVHGDTLFFGGLEREYSSHELWYSVNLAASTQEKFIFLAPVIFSSGMYIYIQKRWSPVVWPSEIRPPIPQYQDTGFGTSTAFRTVVAQYGPVTYPMNSELVSSVAYSGACFFASKDDGIYRFNGTEVHSLKLVRPQVESIRSIPGTKGQFPIRIGENGVKIGKQIQVVFVYSYYDSTNRLMESEFSSPEESIFSPKAATDGSDYAELVEYRVCPPPALTQVATAKLRLDAYVRITDPSTNSDVDYVYYRTVTPAIGKATSVIVGDLSPEYLDGNKLVYSIQEGSSHWSGPKAKYLTTVADRLVALNCKSWDYFKLKIPKVFRSDGTFGAYLFWSCPHVTAGVPAFTETDTTAQFFMFPLGVYPVATGGAPSTITYRPIASAAEVGAYPTAYPDTADAAYPYPAFVTSSIDYTYVWNGTVGCSINGAAAPSTNLTLTYGDTSDRFTLTNAAATSVAGQRVKLRFAGAARPQGLPIDFTGDSFLTYSPIAATTVTLRGTTRWTDSSLDANGVPLALRSTSLLEFPEGYVGAAPFTETNAKRVSASSVKAKDYGIIIDTVGGVTQIRYTYQTSLSTPIFPTTGATKYCVIHGPGTLGNIRKSGTTDILSFDRDLVFEVASAAITGVEIDTDDTGARITHTQIILYPGEFEIDATGAYTWKRFDIVADNTIALGTEEYSMNIFERAALTNPSTVSGFTLPSTTLRVQRATLRIDTLFDVGDYAIFELSDQDMKKIPAGFPRLMPGAFKVLAKGGAGPYYIDVQVPYSPEFRSATTASDPIYLDEYSYVINPKKIFTLANGVLSVQVGFGAQPYAALNRASYYGGAEAYGYLNVRGAAFDSANLELSGFYCGTSGTPATAGTVLVHTQLTSIDYSKITGLRYSSYTLGFKSIPVPAPLKLSTADSLYDLSLPVFSKNPILTDVGLVQVGKRITSAINTLLPQWFYAFNDTYFAGRIELEPNEIAITFNRGAEKYTLSSSDSLRRASPFLWDKGFYFSVKTADTSTFYQATVSTSAGLTTKLNITGLTPHASTLYQSITDNYPNLIQWTNPVFSTVAAPNVPMFAESNTYVLDTQDDSEIVGATAFQNTLIVQKRNSLWRGTFSDVDGSLYFQRIQSPVGGLAHNNMPTNLEHMYFINKEGVFKLDGSSVDPVFKLNNLFADHVVKDEYLMSRTAGFADHKNKQLYIGVPYVSSYITDTADVDGQFVYSYNDSVLGWSVNKGMDAYKWTSLDGEYYFASSRGRVFRLRSEPFLTRYRDGESAIPLVLSTRFLTAGETTKFKFWRNVLFQFGTTSTYNMQVSYQLDFKSTVYPLETYPVTEASIENGAKWYGNDRLLKGLRETLGQRVNQISFLFEEATIDTDCPIYSVNVEGFQTNTRLVPQKNTRAGGDR